MSVNPAVGRTPGATRQGILLLAGLFWLPALLGGAALQALELSDLAYAQVNIRNRFMCDWPAADSMNLCNKHLSWTYTDDIVRLYPADNTDDLVPWYLIPVPGTTDQFYIRNLWHCAEGDSYCGKHLSWASTRRGKLYPMDDTDDLVPWQFVPVPGTTDQFNIHNRWHCAEGDPRCGLFLSIASGSNPTWDTAINPPMTYLPSHPWQVTVLKRTPPGDTGTIGQSGEYGCVIATDGTVSCWGEATGPVEPTDIPSPSGTFLQIDASTYGMCGIRDDGSIDCWNAPSYHYYETSTPGTFTQVVVGEKHACALGSDGGVSCWGNWAGRAGTPAGSFIGISTSLHTNCGVRADLSLTCWGEPLSSYTGPVEPTPAGAYTQVSVGWQHACAIKQSDSTVVCWGSPGRSRVPSGAFKRVVASTSGSGTCGIKTNNTAVCWEAMWHDGWGTWEVKALDPARPNQAFAQIAYRDRRCAVETDGDVYCADGSWNDPDPLQDIPEVTARTQ